MLHRTTRTKTSNPGANYCTAAEISYRYLLLVVGAWPSAARALNNCLCFWPYCCLLSPVHRWSCGNITLLGDACHPATPNNGQGACMAIEDALVLATLLGEYWEQPDGHVEAFYLYEVRGGLFVPRDRSPPLSFCFLADFCYLTLLRLFLGWNLFTVFLHVCPSAVVLTDSVRRLAALELRQSKVDAAILPRCWSYPAVPWRCRSVAVALRRAGSNLQMLPLVTLSFRPQAKPHPASGRWTRTLDILSVGR